MDSSPVNSRQVKSPSQSPPKTSDSSFLGRLNKRSLKLDIQLSHQRIISTPNEHSRIFSNPDDYMLDKFEREQAKLSLGKTSIQRQNYIMKQKRRANDKKILNYDNKIKRILDEKAKKSEELGKRAENQQLNREKHREAKIRITKMILEECKNYGEKLESRMKKLSDQQKEALRKQLKDEQVKIKERIDWEFKKQEINDQNILTQENYSLEMLGNLIQKQEKRIQKYEHNIKTRIHNARQHCQKVEEVMNSSLLNSEILAEINLKRAIEKSWNTDRKMSQREGKIKDDALKMKNRLDHHFARQNKEMKKNKEELHQRIKETMSKVNHIDSVRDKNQKSIDRIKNYRARVNSRRTEEHAGNYQKNIELHMKFKQKVLEKHRRLAEVADRLNKQKQDLSYQKRVSNLEMQKFRNVHRSF